MRFMTKSSLLLKNYTDYEGGFHGSVNLHATFTIPPPYISVFAMASQTLTSTHLFKAYPEAFKTLFDPGKLPLNSQRFPTFKL